MLPPLWQAPDRIVQSVLIVVVLPAPLEVAEQYENIFSFEETIIIRTLPQYSRYHGLYYNGILKKVNSGESLQNGRIIKMGKEYRKLCSD